MAGLIMLSLATSLMTFCQHFSPITANFYVETLRQSKNEAGIVYICRVNEKNPFHPVLKLSPGSYANLMEQRRLGLAPGPPEEDEYLDDDSPPNTQALQLSFNPFEDEYEEEDEEEDDTRSRASLQPRGLTMHRIKASLHARTLFTFGRRKSSDSSKGSKLDSFLSKATSMTKGSSRSKSRRPHPSLSLDDNNAKTTSSPIPDDLPPAARKAQNFLCTPIKGSEEINKVHARVNFYLVAYPTLSEEKQIILPDTKTPSIFLLGVPLLNEKPDWPAFIDGHREDVAMVVALVRQMLVNLIQPEFLKGLSVDSLAAFMSTANFRHFARPVPKMVNRFKSFAELQGNVEEYCGTTRTSESEIILPEDPQKVAAAKTAIRLLVQKMIDPCFMGVEGRKKDPQGAADADYLCNAHCEFLAVGFAVFPNVVDKPAGCSSAIVSGHCSREPRVCKCKQVCGSGDRCSSSRSKSVPMIMCSNLLRRSILPPLSVPGPREGSGKISMRWT